MLNAFILSCSKRQETLNHTPGSVELFVVLLCLKAKKKMRVTCTTRTEGAVLSLSTLNIITPLVLHIAKLLFFPPEI